MNGDIFQFNWHVGHCWFRIFGYGLAVKNIHIHSLSFSERNNFSGVTILDYHFKILEPGRLG